MVEVGADSEGLARDADVGAAAATSRTGSRPARGDPARTRELF